MERQGSFGGESAVLIGVPVRHNLYCTCIYVFGTEFVQDHAVEALINVANARGAEVIAVGHGGGGPLRGALLGSITYELVHRAPLPVLVVPDDPVDD